MDGFMKKSLKLKDGEMLYQWIYRLAVALNLTEEQREAMSEVSRTSYIQGGQDAQKAMNS